MRNIQQKNFKDESIIINYNMLLMWFFVIWIFDHSGVMIGSHCIIPVQYTNCAVFINAIAVFVIEIDANRFKCQPIVDTEWGSSAFHTVTGDSGYCVIGKG